MDQNHAAASGHCTPAGPFTPAQLAHTQSAFADYLRRHDPEQSAAAQPIVTNEALQAGMYRWIRAVAISDSQDEITDALEAISARPVTEAAFDAAIAEAMVRYPLGIEVGRG